MPKSVMFIIFLLAAALAASITLITGEAAPGYVATDVDGDGAETPEPAEFVDPVEPDSTSQLEEGLAAMESAEASTAERLDAAKGLLEQLPEGVSKSVLVEQAGQIQTSLGADPQAEIPQAFLDGVAGLVKAALGE